MKDRMLTPQQELFLSEYVNPKSENFGNARQSALKAGYTENYADNITALMPDWLLESIGDMKRLRKAEKILDKTLEYDPVDENGKIDNSLLKTQVDTAKFFAQTLGKDRFSTRNEITGKDGKDLVPETLSEDEKEKLKSLLK